MGFASTEINKLLDRRARDVASRRHADSLQDHLNRVREDRPKLLRCLGLEPLPAMAELQATITGKIERDGYRIEKLAYKSRANFSVTAHLYLPTSETPVPAIIRPHGHWMGKKSEPVVQASAIGLALAGYAVLVIDSPGDWGEPSELNERADQGDHEDPWLAMGAPVEGFYVWDIMRGLDYLKTRSEIVSDKIGITGESCGGMAALLAFAADERINCAALVCSAPSLEVQPHYSCLCTAVPGIFSLGDRSDLIALRAPAPILLVAATEDLDAPPEAVTKTHEKLKAIYKKFDHHNRPRLEIVEGPLDYNRRMRESVLAFFDEHLRHKEKRVYRPELRPITDGHHNPCAAETVSADSPELRVLPFEERSDETMRALLEQVLVRSLGHLKFDPAARLTPWAKYGRIPIPPSERLTLSDKDLDLANIDHKTCINLGLSAFEVYAQILHIMLPGGIDGWEQSTLGPTGDVMSSLIGSMKALVGSASHHPVLTTVVTEGPFSSMVARVFKLYRPNVEIVLSHEMEGWTDLYDSRETALIQPMARYIEWPWQ